ncbi:tail tubular protein B [Ralstonia phage vB_RsoP_BMB50]|uniref:Tail tubular protein B n=1 Tax=Ralstonia phage vB_RsoP_BMB50 TaxID=2834269 RepID=A0A8F6C6L0_9CAUD|nr:tail tubular protein B [Ralstonia phage vB_RsoP_BMB50]
MPGYEPSVCGDITDKQAVPYFFGKRITNMFVFQDRLGIVANGVVFMSRTGDYFNWFRKSKLRQDADDPIEAFALGSEDDVISQSITYNKDLFLYGERNQYAVPGRSAVTPTTIVITAVAGEKDAMLARPHPVGNLLFYGKYESKLDQTGPSPYAASLHQFQLGLFQDTPETYTASQQLDNYLRGQIVELASLPKPYTVFCRTNGLDNGLYTYRFIDQQGTQARQLDSWSRWEWSPLVGQIIGVTTYKSTLFVHLLRSNPAGVWVACEQFVMDSSTSTRPYLDAQRNGAMYEAGTSTTAFIHSSLTSEQKEEVSVAGIKGYSSFLLGGNVVDYTSLKANVFAGDNMRAMVGIGYDAYFDPTPPYMRDRNDNAIDNGRLTVNRKTVALVETGGMDADLTTVTGTTRVFKFNGRRVGLSNNQVGMQPYTTASVNVPVGRNNTEYSLRLRSRTWLPMCVSNIEWVGQFFLNSRRV